MVEGCGGSGEGMSHKMLVAGQGAGRWVAGLGFGFRV